MGYRKIVHYTSDMIAYSDKCSESMTPVWIQSYPTISECTTYSAHCKHFKFPSMTTWQSILNVTSVWILPHTYMYDATIAAPTNHWTCHSLACLVIDSLCPVVFQMYSWVSSPTASSHCRPTWPPWAEQGVRKTNLRTQGKASWLQMWFLQSKKSMHMGSIQLLWQLWQRRSLTPRPFLDLY